MVNGISSAIITSLTPFIVCIPLGMAEEYLILPDKGVLEDEGVEEEFERMIQARTVQDSEEPIDPIPVEEPLKFQSDFQETSFKPRKIAKNKKRKTETDLLDIQISKEEIIKIV